MVLPRPARGAGTLIPSAQRLVWAAKQALGKAALGHVLRVGDAIQLSHPLSSPSPPALNLSQHQGLFKWVSLPLGLALGSPIFPSGCEGKLGVALESLQGLRDLT